MQEERLHVSEHRSLYLDMPARYLLSLLFSSGGGCYGRTDQPLQRWIRLDLEDLQGNTVFIRKMGNRPLFHKEPLAFIDETNVCV